METREVIEQRIRDAHARGEHEAAATLGIETYGREVLSFLITHVGHQRAQEVFSDFLEDFWRGFPNFTWRSSLRTWTYILARHASVRYLRGPQQRRVQLATSGEFTNLSERIRSDTAAYLRTEVKDRFRELREQLPEDDQTLLILRIDRNLSWNELAMVMAGPGVVLSDSELETASARQRTHFKRAKERLKKLAQAEGLLPRSDDEP